MTVYVVTGPPASGKTTWVREHAKPGDITIDYDDLVSALAPGVERDPLAQPTHVAAVVGAARDAAIDQAATGHGYDTYLVHAMPDRRATNRYRKYGYHIVVCDPGYDECMRRAQLERTPRQQAIVADWYERRGLAV
jgi:hypothetical protein